MQRNDLLSDELTIRLVRGRGRGRVNTWHRYLICPRRLGNFLCCTGKSQCMSQALVPVVTTTQPQTKCMKRAALMWNAPAVIGRMDGTRPKATSLTTALVLAGNDKNLLPPQASSEVGGQIARGQTDKQASRHAQCTCHASSMRQSRTQGDCHRNRNRFPDRPTDNGARGVLFASHSHTLPRCIPSPDSSRKVA